MSHSDLQKGHSKARDAQHALAIFLGVFVSVENKGLLGYIPKLKVAGSIPVARSTSSIILNSIFKSLRNARTVPQTSRRILLRNCQPPELNVIAMSNGCRSVEKGGSVIDIYRDGF